MELDVAKLPVSLSNKVMKELRKLKHDGKWEEGKEDFFFLLTEGVQEELLEHAKTLKRDQVFNSGDEFLEEHKKYEAPKGQEEQIKAVRLAFTSGTQGSRIAPAETIAEAEEAKLHKKSHLPRDEKKEAVVAAFRSRPIVNEIKDS